MKKNIIDDINNALIKINYLIKEENIPEYTNQAQLNSIKNKLLEWIFYLENDSIPSKKESVISRIIIDSWDFNDKLGLQLMNIDENLNLLLSKR